MFDPVHASITVEASVFQFASGAPISGLVAGDTPRLDGFAATGNNFVAGAGLELLSGSSTITLADGCARIPAALLGGARDASVVLAATLPYRADAPRTRRTRLG